MKEETEEVVEAVIEALVTKAIVKLLGRYGITIPAKTVAKGVGNVGDWIEENVDAIQERIHNRDTLIHKLKERIHE